MPSLTRNLFDDLADELADLEAQADDLAAEAPPARRTACTWCGYTARQGSRFCSADCEELDATCSRIEAKK
ncbi:MAG TPA: hypothetical protein VM529_24845 [Gemmata sp.]|jgi:hypothetical protein|nr:hypothetical protein [Gemmata sp.]